MLLKVKRELIQTIFKCVSSQVAVTQAIKRFSGSYELLSRRYDPGHVLQRMKRLLNLVRSYLSLNDGRVLGIDVRSLLELQKLDGGLRQKL